MPMRLLADTDAFWKLAAARLFEDALEVLGVADGDCACLPALPHMLRRGRLRKRLGDELADGLLPQAEAMGKAPAASSISLDLLAGVEGIDLGEAQLTAVAAEQGLMVVSGDKRALRSLAGIEEFREPLAGKIVVLEALLLALCDHLGIDEVRDRVQVLVELDKTVAICFSPGNDDPAAALESYYRSLVEEVDPLVLWSPEGEEPA